MISCVGGWGVRLMGRGSEGGGGQVWGEGGRGGGDERKIE